MQKLYVDVYNTYGQLSTAPWLTFWQHFGKCPLMSMFKFGWNYFIQIWPIPNSQHLIHLCMACTFSISCWTWHGDSSEGDHQDSKGIRHTVFEHHVFALHLKCDMYSAENHIKTYSNNKFMQHSMHHVFIVSLLWLKLFRKVSNLSRMRDSLLSPTCWSLDSFPRHLAVVGSIAIRFESQ